MLHNCILIPTMYSYCISNFINCQFSERSPVFDLLVLCFINGLFSAKTNTLKKFIFDTKTKVW